MRIFRTCRVMNISTVAVYTHVDRGALHVRYAEEAYCISESPEDTSYLKPELILSIAKKTGAAIHPGYGFLSENADFARRCEEEGVIFIGPSADIISKMGIKTEARKIMREAGLPIVPGTETPVQGIDEVKKVANEVGYPIMLKALAGGGGKGPPGRAAGRRAQGRHHALPASRRQDPGHRALRGRQARRGHDHRHLHAARCRDRGHGQDQGRPHRARHHPGHGR